MSSAGIDFQGVVRNSEHDSVGGIDTDTPFPGKVALERFGLADAIIAIAVDALHKHLDPLRHSRIALNDVAELIPGFVVPNLFHVDRLCRMEGLFAVRCLAFANFSDCWRVSASAIRRSISSSVCS